MTEQQLYQAVANATGESMRQVKQLGFSLVKAPRVVRPCANARLRLTHRYHRAPLRRHG